MYHVRLRRNGVQVGELGPFDFETAKKQARIMAEQAAKDVAVTIEKAARSALAKLAAFTSRSEALAAARHARMRGNEATVRKERGQYAVYVRPAGRTGGRSNPMLTIDRAGYTTKRGTRVAEKGPHRKEEAWIQKEGALGGPGYTQRPADERHQLLEASLRRDGWQVTWMRLNVLLRPATLHPETRKVLKADAKWLQKTHGGEGATKRWPKR